MFAQYLLQGIFTRTLHLRKLTCLACQRTTGHLNLKKWQKYLLRSMDSVSNIRSTLQMFHNLTLSTSNWAHTTRWMWSLQTLTVLPSTSSTQKHWPAGIFSMSREYKSTMISASERFKGRKRAENAPTMENHPSFRPTPTVLPVNMNWCSSPCWDVEFHVCRTLATLPIAGARFNLQRIWWRNLAKNSPPSGIMSRSWVMPTQMPVWNHVLNFSLSNKSTHDQSFHTPEEYIATFFLLNLLETSFIGVEKIEHKTVRKCHT